MITFVFASGHRGPTTVFYSASRLSRKAARKANARYAPECIFHDTRGRSHMMDGEHFVWYLDVVVREGLRQQRAWLDKQGRVEDARKLTY